MHRFTNPISSYEDKIKSGDLDDDSYQRHIIEDLQRLHNRLKGYQPKAPSNSGFLSKVYISGHCVLTCAIIKQKYIIFSIEDNSSRPLNRCYQKLCCTFSS